MPNWIEALQSSTRPAYLAVVDAIRAALADGSLRPDDRLPTHRQLAEHLGLARGTVLRGYREAERLGLVRGCVGRGTFVRADFLEVQPQARPVAPDDAVLDLSANRPLYTLDPSLAEVLQAVARDPDADRLTRYADIAGLPHHLRTGARWLADWGVDADPADVTLCAGAQHAVHCALASVATAGDTIAAESLTYASLRTIADSIGLRLAGVPLDAGGLRPDALAAACALRRLRAIYTIPTIHNPTGACLPEPRRHEIVALARRHDLYIIEDDIHRLYHPSPPPTFASLAPERTIFIAATSKCLAGGLRVAFVRTPPALRDAIRRAVLSTVWNAAPLMAEIACRWIEDGTARAVLARKRAECTARHALARRLLPPSMTLLGHPGGLSTWAHLPPAWSSADFALHTQRQGVLISPDAVFAIGEPPASPAIRISLSAPDSHASLARGLDTIAALLTHRPAATPQAIPA